MPLLAGPAHPKGPEGRSLVERTLRIHGVTKDCVLTLAYPKSDEPSLARVAGQDYWAFMPDARNDLPLLILNYDFQGHFWQGVFGSTSFEVGIAQRNREAAPWSNLESLQEHLDKQGLGYNLRQMKNPPTTRGERQKTETVELNGTRWVIQREISGGDPDLFYYYFPFEEDYALKIRIWHVDNSHRPGLPHSDWRPRSETFAKQLLATVKVRIEAGGSR